MADEVKELEFREIKMGDVSLIVLVSSGPRIMGIRYEDRPYNPCFVDPRDGNGQWLVKRGDWALMGGTRVWIHQGEETEGSYMPDNDPCSVAEIEPDGSIEITSALIMPYNIIKGFRIRELETNVISVIPFAHNTSDMVACMGVWELTCFNQHDNAYKIPIGGGKGFQTFAENTYLDWGGHSSKVVDLQFQYEEDALTVEPDGQEAKRVYRIPRGITWCLFPDGDFTLVKIFPWHPKRWSAYPGGYNAAVYISPSDVADTGKEFFESEVMGPLELVQPGEEITLLETWVFLDGLVEDKEEVIAAIKPYC